MNRIDTIKKLGIKLKYSIKDKYQIYSLPFIFPFIFHILLS